MRKIKKYLSPSGSLPVWQTPAGEDWQKEWKFRLTPASRSKVAGGWSSKEKKKKASESGELYTKRRIKEETKRTWRSDAADIAHGIGEGALALHPYTAIPYYGAKVGQDFLNGNLNLSTALNASIPLFHLSPQAVGLREATNVALEDAANAGSKTARNWRVAREINLATRNNKPNIEVPNSLIRTKIGDVEIDNPLLYYRLGSKEMGDDFSRTGIVSTDNEGFVNPMFAQGRLWYGVPTLKMLKLGTGVLVKTSSGRTINLFKRNEESPKTDLLISNAEMVPANLRSTPLKWVTTIDGTTSVLNWGGRRVPQTMATKDNTVRYVFNPNYGYKQVVQEPSTSLKFFERKPSRISFAERVGVPKGDRNLSFKSKQPTEHVLGNEAVKMFKEYGGEPIPEGSINGEQLRKYVAEARERYGLVGNNNVTDEEIAQALYKHSKELGGNTAAVNALREPLLLFRGDTQRYTQLKKRMSPEELAKKSGTMDNSLGNLFLGEFPDSWRGVDRYIGTWRNFNGSPKLVGSGTGSKVVWDGKTASEIEGYPYLGPLAGGGYKLYSQPHRYGNVDVYKLPASMMESGVNDLNAFIVRTPQMRNASNEISVLNDDWMLQGAKDSHFMSKNYKYNPKTYSMENVKTGESLGEITTESAPESRAAMGDHYKELLKEAKQKQLGLLKSEANAPLRDEHSLYSYFVLPNFNIQGAKHLLPYDLRIPRNWKDKNIYRGLIPLTTGYTLYNIFNHPQLQYLRQGGKMNTLLFLKNGSGIHIKKKNKGKFTDYCGGLVTQECINRGKHSSNPAVRKRATFADNARKWKHKNGGKAFVEGVNVLDSNPKAYKYVKKKYKMRSAADGAKFDWTSTLANVGSSILQRYFLNGKISREAEAAKAMNKLTSKDFFDIYNLKLQEAKQLEEQLAKATEAIIGTTINPSNIVAANNAWKNASGEYAALKNNVDLQNRAIDAQAQALKSNIWGNAISGVMQQGVGLLSNYLNNKKSSNITTGITTPSITTSSYNYFSAPKKFGTFNNDGSMNLGYNMTWSTDKGVQTKNWSDGIFNKSITDYLK